MIIRLLFYINTVRMDISNDLFIAIENQKMGKISEAQKFFTDNMYEYSKEMVFVSKHIDFLMSIGDYDTILRRYGHLDLDQVQKAKEYINIINTRDYKRISKLISVSGFSPVVLKAAVREALSASNMKAADEYIKKDLGMSDISDDLSYFTSRFDTIRKISDLKNLYHSVNTKSFSDYFTPSIYTHLKISILNEYISLGVRHGYTQLTSMAKILYKSKNDEESRYLYIMSLINDGFPDKARKELNAQSFKNTQQVPRTEKAGTDFLGYYNLLGVNKDSSPRDIKKAYAKIIAKNTRKLKTDKQKKDWEKKHVKYNKALQVLSTPKKKKMYDNGVDPDSPQGQYNRHHQQHREFKGFENFGPFSDFFNDFGSREETSSRINIMFEEELGDFLSRLGKKGGDKRAFKYISEEEESENSQWDLKNESSLIDQNFKIQEKSKIDDSASSSNLVEFNENTTYIKESEMVGLISNEVD
ncbi:hypothetical protein P3W45_001842 [Vairimorpha bombi]